MTTPPEYLRELLDMVADKMGSNGAEFAALARELTAAREGVIMPKLCALTLVWDEQFPEYVLISGRAPDESEQLPRLLAKMSTQIDVQALRDAAVMFRASDATETPFFLWQEIGLLTVWAEHAI